MTQIINEEWRLETLRIDFQSYGEFKGKHICKVEFKNSNNDAFTFNLSPDETLEYIHIINKKIIQSASYLGDKLLASLGLLPAPKIIEIEVKEQQLQEQISELTEQPTNPNDDIPF